MFSSMDLLMNPPAPLLAAAPVPQAPAAPAVAVAKMMIKESRHSAPPGLLAEERKRCQIMMMSQEEEEKEREDGQGEEGERRMMKKKKMMMTKMKENDFDYDQHLARIKGMSSDELLIVPEFDNSFEGLYLESSALSFGEPQEADFSSAGGCGGEEAPEYPRLFKLEDLLALEDDEGCDAGFEPPRVLQQGTDGLFEWLAAPLDMGHDDSPVASVAASRLSSPSPSPALGPDAEELPATPGPAGNRDNRKRKTPPAASIPSLPPKKRRLGVVMDDEERRERNRVSALKYRQKKLSGAYVTQDRVEELERENQLLQFEIMKEKQAIAELRVLLTKYGLIPS